MKNSKYSKYLSKAIFICGIKSTQIDNTSGKSDKHCLSTLLEYMEFFHEKIWKKIGRQDYLGDVICQLLSQRVQRHMWQTAKEESLSLKHPTKPLWSILGSFFFLSYGFLYRHLFHSIIIKWTHMYLTPNFVRSLREENVLFIFIEILGNVNMNLLFGNQPSKLCELSKMSFLFMLRASSILL